jgi:hypothetical protein
VKANPLLPHVRDTLSPPPQVDQGAVGETGARHPPVPLAAVRGQVDFVTREPQGQQMASTGARPLPLFPIAEPYPPPPVVQRNQRRRAMAMTEVVEPSGDLPLQGLEAGFHSPPVAPCGDLADALFEPLDRGIGPAPRATFQLEAQESARAQARGLALGPVDPPSHASLDEAAEAVPHPLRCCLAASAAPDVVGLPREPQSAPFPVGVQLIEPHLGPPR